MDAEENKLSNLLKAYTCGQLSPEAAKQLEDDVHNGLISVPDNIKIRGGNGVIPREVQPVELPQGVIDAYNLGATDPYNRNALSEEARHALDRDLRAGLVKLPLGSTLNPAYLTNALKAIDLLTGALREDTATKSMPDYSKMPEMNDVTSFRTWLATFESLTGGPEDIAKTIISYFPHVKAFHDGHNNVVLQSADNGKQYVITPGITPSDVLNSC
jgi:hypothetical protein